MGEAEVGVGGEFGGEAVPAALGVGTEGGGWLTEAELEELAEPMLVAYEVIESAIGFDGQGFLQPCPQGLEIGCRGVGHQFGWI